MAIKASFAAECIAVSDNVTAMTVPRLSATRSPPRNTIGLRSNPRRTPIRLTCGPSGGVTLSSCHPRPLLMPEVIEAEPPPIAAASAPPDDERLLLVQAAAGLMLEYNARSAHLAA